MIQKKHNYTKEERSNYNSFKKRVGICRDIMKPTVYINPIEPSNFTYEPVYCYNFGCGKQLTPMETRYGNKCLSCTGKKRPDPTYFIKH